MVLERKLMKMVQVMWEYSRMERNGQGTYTYSDGDKYEGEWKDGKRTGQGTYTYGKGE